MTTIDRNGDLHAGDGKYTNKPQSAAGFDLVVTAPERPTWSGRHDGEIDDLPLSALIATRSAMTEVFGAGRVSETPDEPVLVRACEADPARWEIADGHHRVADATRSGRTTVRVDFDTMSNDEPYDLGDAYDFTQHETTAAAVELDASRLRLIEWAREDYEAGPGRQVCTEVAQALSTGPDAVGKYAAGVYKGPEVHGDYAHDWVVMSDGTIIDATADQFPGSEDEPVRVIGPGDPRYEWYQAV